MYERRHITLTWSNASSVSYCGPFLFGSEVGSTIQHSFTKLWLAWVQRSKRRVASMWFCIASYPGSSTEKWGGSLEDLITCPVDKACVALAHTVWLEILPSIVKLQTIVVAWVLDVARTYGSTVLPFMLLVGYDKFSFYQGIVAPGLFGSTGARDGRLVDAQSMSKRWLLLTVIARSPSKAIMNNCEF